MKSNNNYKEREKINNNKSKPLDQYAVLKGNELWKVVVNERQRMCACVNCKNCKRCTMNENSVYC